MLPVQITIRDIPTSSTLDSLIRKKVDKLHQFYDRISSCRVVVETAQKHKHQGKLYNVRIDITVPGKEFVATHHCHEDIYVALRDAFEAISRQLEEHARKRHGRVKSHDGLMHGHVVRMIPQEGYGFIDGIDGNEYYFSMTNVKYPNFNKLLTGDTVEFIASIGSEGMRAERVVREESVH